MRGDFVEARGQGSEREILEEGQGHERLDRLKLRLDVRNGPPECTNP
jgi:hypothetical protein